jgi:chromosome segregation ATPase
VCSKNSRVRSQADSDLGRKDSKIAALKEKKKALQGTIDELKPQLNDAIAARDQALLEAQTKGEEVNSLSQKLQDEAENALNGVLRELGYLRNSINEASGPRVVDQREMNSRNELWLLRNEKLALQSRNAGLLSENSRLQQSTETLNSSVKELKRKLEIADTSLRETQGAFNLTTRDRQGLEFKFSTLETEKEKIERQRNDFEAELTEATKQQDSLNKQV